MKRPALAALLAATLGACSSMGGMMGGTTAGGPPVKTSNGVLTDAGGMTLYTFDRDTAGAGRSVCNGPCAANWPPLKAADGARGQGDWSVVTRDDGSRQWAYKGKPVYGWVKDTKPGDRTGDGVNGVWRVATQ